MKKNQGFTILEIMIVVSAIGLLAVIAIPSFVKARHNSQKNVCLQNQRLITDAVMEYEFINREAMAPIASDGAAIRDALMNGDFFRNEAVFECPASQTRDFNDYTLEYEATELQSIVCQIREDEHKLAE